MRRRLRAAIWAIGQRGLLDQAAHRGDRGVGVRPARAARPRRDHGGRVVGKPAAALWEEEREGA